MSGPTPPLRLSCRLELLPGEAVYQRISAAHAFGFDGVSLPGRFLGSYLADLRACLPDLPLPLVSLSLGFEGSLVSPRAEARARCRESLLGLFDLCAELGIGSVNMPPVLMQDNPERLADADAQDTLLVEQLPGLADKASARGVVLLLEPVNRFESEYLNTLGHAARLCARINHPHLGCTADFFHMQLEELDPAGALREAGGWVRHVHVAENTRVEPGPGVLDFGPGFAALKGMGYAGWVEVEARSLSGPAGEVLPRSVGYLRGVWG
jgi:sugar phosphate isomerase/epimerase